MRDVRAGCSQKYSKKKAENVQLDFIFISDNGFFSPYSFLNSASFNKRMTLAYYIYPNNKNKLKSHFSRSSKVVM